jgi:hypothetical protein
MKTLKNQLNINFENYEIQSNQECTIIERKMATNGCGAEFILVDFISNGHPYATKGLTVIVIEEGYIAEIDKDYVRSIFNR